MNCSRRGKQRAANPDGEQTRGTPGPPPRAAPPEWLLYLILVQLLGGAGVASLYLS